MLIQLISLLLVSQASAPDGEGILNQMAGRYAAANGIQWTIQSRTYSRIFEESTVTRIQFYFNRPDTFYYKGESEEVIGIADTIWTLSKQHKQIQKRIAESYLTPTDFVTKWNERYILKGYMTKGDRAVFELAGKENVSPANVKLTLDKLGRIIEIFYKDVSGDDVTLSIFKERLRRSSKIDLFYLHIPQGYKLIDLVEE